MSAKKPLRFLITDDHAVVRRGLKQILSEAFRGAKFGEVSRHGVAEPCLDCRSAALKVQRKRMRLPSRSSIKCVGGLADRANRCALMAGSRSGDARRKYRFPLRYAAARTLLLPASFKCKINCQHEVAPNTGKFSTSRRR